jgi:hypothetical protein
MKDHALQAPPALWLEDAEAVAWRAPVMPQNDGERVSLGSARLYNQFAEAAEARGHYQLIQNERAARLGYGEPPGVPMPDG